MTGSGSAPPSSGQTSPPASSQSSEANNQRNSPSLEDQLNSNAQVGYLLDSRVKIKIQMFEKKCSGQLSNLMAE